MSRRARRRAYWAAVAATLAVGIAGSAVAGAAYVRERDPAAVVREYFDAIADGRAADALALGDIPDGERGYLTAEVLRAQLDAGRVQRVRIGEVDRRGDRAVVAVAYRLSARDGSEATVSDEVPVRRHGVGWLLERAAVVVPAMAADAASRVALAGAPLPSEPILLLPGALPLTTNAPALAFDLGASAVTFAGEAPSATPVLAPTAQAEIGFALDSALTACLRDNAAMADCPLEVPDARLVPGSLDGLATTPPSAGARVTLQTDPAGVVRVRGTFVMSATWTELDFDNIASKQSGQVTVRYGATVTLVDPMVVQWDPR